MKKVIFVIISFIMMVAGCAGGAKPAENPAEKPADELDAAIRETSDYLNKQLPRGNKLVILNIQSEFPALSEYIIDELIANTVNDRVFSVVDRYQLDMIRAELDFQMSGEVDDNTAQELGRMAGAQIIISGAVSRIGDLYRLRIRALNVQTASIEGQFNRNIPGGSTVTALTGSQATGYGGSGTVAGTDRRAPASAASPAPAASTVTPAPAAQTPATTAVQVPVQAAPPQPVSAPASSAIAIEVTARSAGTLFFQDKEVAKLWDNDTHTIPIEGPGTYIVKMVMSDHTETRSVVINARGITKISFGGVYAMGQAGPAGGLIFFDKGSYSDGWRYLEAAPVSTEFTAAWGANGKSVSGTSTAWGYGKANTQKIVEALSRFEEIGQAAQLCANLNYSGLNDWFLPSKDELDLMYKNLKEKGLGGFKNDSYWSSSQIDNSSVWRQDFSSGRQDGVTTNYWGGNYKDSVRAVRACRQF